MKKMIDELLNILVLCIACMAIVMVSMMTVRLFLLTVIIPFM